MNTQAPQQYEFHKTMEITAQQAIAESIWLETDHQYPQDVVDTIAPNIEMILGLYRRKENDPGTYEDLSRVSYSCITDFKLGLPLKALGRLSKAFSSERCTNSHHAFLYAKYREQLLVFLKHQRTQIIGLFPHESNKNWLAYKNKIDMVVQLMDQITEHIKDFDGLPQYDRAGYLNLYQ